MTTEQRDMILSKYDYVEDDNLLYRIYNVSYLDIKKLYCLSYIKEEDKNIQGFCNGDVLTLLKKYYGLFNYHILIEKDNPYIKLIGISSKEEVGFNVLEDIRYCFRNDLICLSNENDINLDFSKIH